MKYIKLTILLICALFATVQSQTTYTASKYKQVWYVSGTEKLHATFAAYDTSSLLISNTSNVPTITQLSATGTTLFKLDETGAFANYAGSTTLPWLLKTNFDDSLNNAHTFTGILRFTQDIIPTSNGGADIGQTSLRYDSVKAATGDFSGNVFGTTYGSDATVSNAELLYINSLSSNAQDQFNLKLFMTAFDDSLNNNHTITGINRWTNDIIPTTNGGADIGQTTLRHDSIYASGALDIRTNIIRASVLNPSSLGIYAGASTDTMLVLSNDRDATKDSTSFLTADGDWTFGNDLIMAKTDAYVGRSAGPKIVFGGNFDLYSGSALVGYLTGNNFNPGANDARSFGVTSGKWQSIWLSDNVYLGGKSQTAKLIIGTQNTMTEETDSTQVLTMLNGNPINYYYASDGDAYTQSINTSDQAVFAGAAGYDFDEAIILSNGVTAGAAAFCTNAVKDTVAIASALSTDIYTFDWTSDPGSPGAHWYEAYAGGVYFYTDAATTGNPAYTWTRWGKN